MQYAVKCYYPGEYSAGIYPWEFKMELSDPFMLDREDIAENIEAIREMLSGIYDVPKDDIVVDVVNASCTV